MAAGDRNRLVELRKPSGADAGWGQPDKTPAAMELVAKMWVNIRSLSGTATIKAGADTSIVRVSIRGNYRTNATHDMEIWHGTTRYRIKSIMPDEARREFTDYVCEVVS